MKGNRDEIISYLKGLRDLIIQNFESLELQGKKFQRTEWPYTKGQGGGEMSVLRGDIFEKAAVNWSGVAGDRFPGSETESPFFATGVSLITHMKNPKMPTVHFNIRYIEKEDQRWFGGGFDLTPMGFPFEEDTRHFHQVAKETLDAFGPEFYPTFTQNAKEYFYIPHRQRERGVGGIFFDHFHTEDFARDFALWKAVGDHFLEAIMPIYRRRLHATYTEADQKLQYERRAHYVEFNLLYDRGTKFGFQSGGNPEAILCSMPPMASW